MLTACLCLSAEKQPRYQSQMSAHNKFMRGEVKRLFFPSKYKQPMLDPWVQLASPFSHTHAYDCLLVLVCREAAPQLEPVEHVLHLQAR